MRGLVACLRLPFRCIALWDPGCWSRHYRMDFLVGGLLVLEIKAIETLLPVHSAQVLTYLRLGGYRLGLLLNFGQPTLKAGIRRFVNSA